MPTPAALARATNVGVDVPEAELRDGGHVGAEHEHRGAGRRDVVGRDLVAELDQDRRAQASRARLARAGTVLDVRALDHAGARGVGRRRRRTRPAIDAASDAGQRGSAGAPRVARIGDDAGQRGDGRRDGRAQVDRVLRRAAPPREVPVERAQALRAGGGHVADARAGAAGRLGDIGARGQQVGEQALARHHLEDAVAAREDDEGHRRRHLLAAQRVASPPTCPPTSCSCTSRPSTCSMGVPATSDDRHHAVGRAGQRDQRLERPRSTSISVVVLGVGIGGDRLPVALAPEQPEVLARHLVRREHAGRERQLRAHVADRRALGQREARRRPARAYSKILPLPPRTV